MGEARFAVEDEVFVPLSVIVGGYVYIEQGDDQITLTKAGARQLADGLRERIDVPAMTDAGIPMGEVREALALALRFHDTYERLAPSFGYETRPDTRAFDPTSPNGKLMIAVCGELLAFADTPPPAAAGDRALAVDLHVRLYTILATLKAEDFSNPDIGAAYAEEARGLVVELEALRTPEPNSGEAGHG